MLASESNSSDSKLIPRQLAAGSIHFYNMIIKLNKFGTTLTSRQDGKEAYNAFFSTLKFVPDNEEIEIDFDGVVTFTPSWADEFITPILSIYGSRVKLINTQNPSVEATLRLLEKIK